MIILHIYCFKVQYIMLCVNLCEHQALAVEASVQSSFIFMNLSNMEPIPTKYQLYHIRANS